MDHLPRPSPRYYHEKAETPPYSKLLANLHDGVSREAFELYPSRRGLRREALQTGCFAPDQSHRAAALVQNWLFFGLLEEVFKSHVPVKDFTKLGEGDGPFLGTHMLGEYVRRWKDAVEKCTDDEKLAWATRARDVFRQAAAFFQLYGTGLRQHYPDEFVEYINPLLVLLDTVQQHVTDVFADGKEHEPLPTNFSRSAGLELIGRGWCPFTICNILLPSSSPCLFEYARLFCDHPPFIHQDHARCDSEGCAVTNVDTSTYRTLHYDGLCRREASCEFVHPDFSTIETTLRAGEIPVVSLSSDAEQSLTTSSTTDGPYIAISHVWADGLGSTSEKGIPKCVASFLANAAVAAYNAIETTAPVAQIPFWIDSICVPAQPDLRSKAIGLMASTYASAAAVVVVDTSIRCLSVSDPVSQQLFVIYASNWVQRLWTLQEALLSKQLLFMVGDGLVDAMCFFVDDVMTMRLGDPVLTKLLGWFGQMMVTPMLRRAYAQAGLLPPRPNLDDVLLHLAKRSSSRVADETLAVAGLFELNAGDFVALNAEDRMAKFLGECLGGTVPRDIVFLEGNKLTKQGWGWAPKSFMQKRLGLELRGGFDSDMAHVTENGLLGDYHCLILKPEAGNERKPDKYKIKCEDGEELVAILGTNLSTSEPPGDLLYDVLVLLRPVDKGEESLAIGASAIETLSIDRGDGEEEALRLETACYVHVFNEARNEAWQGLHTVYSAAGSLRVVILS